MDPTGPLKWTSKFSSLFQAVFAISTLYIIHFSPFNHVGTLLWSLWNSTKGQGALLDHHGPQNGPHNGSCEANSRGPSIEKGPPGSFHGPNWSIEFTAWSEVNPTFGSRAIIF